MEFTEALGLAGVAFITLIIGLIGAAKRVGAILPVVGPRIRKLPNDVWFAGSLVLGMTFQTIFWFTAIGVPKNGLEWFSLCVLGLQFGLSAGKAYDEQKERRADGVKE